MLGLLEFWKESPLLITGPTASPLVYIQQACGTEVLTVDTVHHTLAQVLDDFWKLLYSLPIIPSFLLSLMAAFLDVHFSSPSMLEGKTNFFRGSNMPFQYIITTRDCGCLSSHFCLIGTSFRSIAEIFTCWGDWKADAGEGSGNLEEKSLELL